MTAPAQPVQGVEGWIRQQAASILDLYRFDSSDDRRRAKEAFEILAERARAGSGLPGDVVRLVIAARTFAYSDPFPEDKAELDNALEAFANRVGWEDEPDEEAALASQADGTKGEA